MTLNYPRLAIALAVAALIGLAFHEATVGRDVCTVVTVITAIESAMALTGAFGVAHVSRSAVVARVVCIIFMVLSLIVNSIFICFDFRPVPYLIVNGLISAIFLLTVVSVIQSRQ